MELSRRVVKLDCLASCPELSWNFRPDYRKQWGHFSISGGYEGDE